MLAIGLLAIEIAIWAVSISTVVGVLLWMF